MIKRFWLRVKSFFWNLYGTLLLKTKFKLDDDTIAAILMHMDMRYGVGRGVSLVGQYYAGTYEMMERSVDYADAMWHEGTIPEDKVSPLDKRYGRQPLPKVNTFVRTKVRNLTPELYKKIRDYVAAGLYDSDIPQPDKLTLELNCSSDEVLLRRKELSDHTSKSRRNLFIERITGPWYSNKAKLEEYQNPFLYKELSTNLDNVEPHDEFPPMHGEETSAE